jgi:hypothetical protein
MVRLTAYLYGQVGGLPLICQRPPPAPFPKFPEKGAKEEDVSCGLIFTLPPSPYFKFLYFKFIFFRFVSSEFSDRSYWSIFKLLNLPNVFRFTNHGN